MNDERYLVVVSGPSGAGKDTVVKAMMDKNPQIEISVSATTRAKREGEVHGKDYYFLTREEFEQKVEQGLLLEYTQYVGNYYGTLKSEVDKRISNKITTVLVIEVNGSANIKKIYPECTTVFVVPPSKQELEKRLRSRGTETSSDIEKRMATAESEMALADTYNFTVVNDDVQKCANEIYAILKSRQEGDK